jgi:ferric-dicitrate binding protein FerR (iron transport regulator)
MTFHPDVMNSARFRGRIALRLVVAAASVALIVLGLRQFWPENAKHEKIAFAARPSDTGKLMTRGGLSIFEWQLKANHTDQKLKIKLEDGSVVSLFPHSSIRYAKHFTDPSEYKRDIYLQGQAIFDVTKEKSRPFTVYAGNMSTTVLGTSFSVAENDKGVLVKLYSGKVMIHAVQQNAWTKDIVLKPGEQLRVTYDQGANLAIITAFDTGKPAPKETNAGSGDGPKGLVFDNTELPEVMNKLIGYYHTRIAYNKTELSSMYFSGQVLATDSLSVILKVIAKMNGLQVTQTTDGFTVNTSKD